MARGLSHFGSSMTQEINRTDENSGDGKSILRVVEEALRNLQLEVKSGSCADFARLLQLLRELRKEEEIENVREIEVTWIDPTR